MVAQIQPRHYIYLALIVLILIGYAGLLVLWRHQRGEINSLSSQLNQLQANQAATQGSSYYDVTVAPSENAVYLPLARLKLQATTLNEGLVYNYSDSYKLSGSSKVFLANLTLSTHDLAAYAVSTTQQFDCAEVVYADFVTPSYPVNPMWKSDGSDKLADGRTMNVYYAPSIPGCQGSWRNSSINSKAIADSLKQATSY